MKLFSDLTALFLVAFVAASLLFSQQCLGYGGNTNFDSYAAEQAPDSYECDIEGLAFQEGEYLEYKIYYNWKAVWIPAGTAKFKTNSTNLWGREVFHLKTEGKSLSSYDWFFKVRDKYETYVDKETMKPLKFVRDVYEGGYTIKQQFTFDHNSQKANIDFWYRKDKLQEKDKKVTVTPCVQDIVSALYYTRCIDFSSYKVGETAPVDLFVDGEIYPVYVRYKGKGEIKTDLGTFKCIKISPMLIEGDVFKGGEGMTIWATDDENRIPVYIESPISVGSVRGYITKYEGLRHRLSAKK